ncbi:MAG: Gfo/Idh/MocA family oxidoreductase [Pirellulaceae bacterium]|nr:Gfo/Idh/MocA family oxidoreductase [Pirellulaceae bacterium]
MNLSPEEKEVGRDNYYEAMGVTRREFLGNVIGAGAISGVGLGAMYFGYEKITNPVRIGVIGTGDEGNVLIGALNPEYVQVVAIADIRPSSIHRAFHGDWASDAAWQARKGLMHVYGWKTEDEARKHVKVYDGTNGGYEALLADPDIEAVIIALPLHLHAISTCKALKAGKHVLVEKLMAHNIAQCKVMGRLAYEKGLYLAVGHQRHYSILYDNAVNLLRWGLLGKLHHIRAQWHRGNLPGRDSWQQPLPGGEVVFGDAKPRDIIQEQLKRLKQDLAMEKNAAKAENLAKKVAQWEAWNRDREVNAEEFGYISTTLPNGRPRPAMEELCRWRLWDRTGGGLMAELGSHQLDASGIFISALRADGKKAHPLSVHTVGGRHLFPLDRDADDHVYAMYEFAGPHYEPGFDVGFRDDRANYPDPKKGLPGYSEDPNKRVVVTYSSINGNGFGGYGEIVMGTKGTLVLDREQEVMLYAGSDTTSRVTVKEDGGGATMDTQASGPAGAVAKAAESMGPVSRGYTEQIEHWAWCIRNKSPENQPRCKPEVALGDAVIALATNVAMKKSWQGDEPGYLKFDDNWYELNHDATPDGSSVPSEYDALVKES